MSSAKVWLMCLCVHVSTVDGYFNHTVNDPSYGQVEGTEWFVFVHVYLCVPKPIKGDV